MAEKEATQDEGLDEDGLVIQKHVSMVLVVLPPRDFGEQTLRHARSSLHNVHVGTFAVSTNTEELITGRLQDEFLVDGSISEASMKDYSGLILVGGEGASELRGDADTLRLIREADAEGKMIGAWGHSVALLAEAGILKGRRVTGAPEVAEAVRAARGKFSGRQLEKDRNIATASDEAVGLRFGKALVQIVSI